MSSSIITRAALVISLFVSVPAWASYECVDMTQQACSVCTDLATDLCFEDAAAQYNMCAELYAGSQILINAICQPKLIIDNSDCAAHVGDFDFTGTIAALNDLGECDGGGDIDDVCPCDDPWTNHGQYVSCVAQAANDLVSDGALTKDERKDTVRAAARSECGK
jgi:hypothetical protein